MRAAASFSSFSRRPVMTTFAPSATNRLAVASPIPLLPPVMTATLPSSFFDMTGSPWRKDDRGQKQEGKEQVGIGPVGPQRPPGALPRAMGSQAVGLKTHH